MPGCYCKNNQWKKNKKCALCRKQNRGNKVKAQQNRIT